MNKLKDIRSFDDAKEFLILNKELIKKAALPITVAAALLFFWSFGGDGDEKIRETDAVPGIAAEESSAEGEEPQPIGDIYVDISGCVNKPGVYRITSGTRLFQLIEEAGGLTEDADTEGINRAEEVYDGQKINIYSKEETVATDKPPQENTDGKININRADAKSLQEIPGIGPATAQKILEYREQTGRFATPEDIKNVSGIGEKTFESMREYITV